MDAINPSAFTVKEALSHSESLFKDNHTAVKDSLLENRGSLLATFIFALLVHFIWGFFTVPAHLRHLPCVPIFPLLRSYLSGEVEDTRLRRLILPFANEKGEGVVLVWALGRWMVHLLDEKVCATFVQI